MIDTLRVFEELSKGVDERTARFLSSTLKGMYEELSSSVRRSDIEELEARIDARFEKLEAAVERLAEAQARTDARLETLAEAQARTDVQLGVLTERMDALTERMDALTEAQKHTEEVIVRLGIAIERNSKQIGGLSHTVGYTLENAAYRALPRLLEHDWELYVTGPLRRDWYPIAGVPREVNIIGEGQKGGRPLLIVGESKTQLSKKKVDQFIRHRVAPLREEGKSLFPIIVTHMTSQPDVIEHAAALGVTVYLSYQFDQ